MGPPGEGEEGGEGGSRWNWDPPPGTGREGKGMEGRMWVGREGRGGRGNKHTRFKTSGAADVAAPSQELNPRSQPSTVREKNYSTTAKFHFYRTQITILLILTHEHMTKQLMH